mmetsp:Transcript_14613/g.41463  ORF Transcript_14613/g.41463 Transcript_14613/m.41463 type:complete len:91 (+) Transcript_14613:249-521(+)
MQTIVLRYGCRTRSNSVHTACPCVAFTSNATCRTDEECANGLVCASGKCNSVHFSNRPTLAPSGVPMPTHLPTTRPTPSSIRVPSVALDL